MYTIFCGYSGYLPEGSRTGIESLEELRAALMEELEFHASGMNPEYEDDKLAIESIVSEISALTSLNCPITNLTCCMPARGTHITLSGRKCMEILLAVCILSLLVQMFGGKV